MRVQQCVRFARYARSLSTRPMVPIPRRASSFLVVVFIHVNTKEEDEGETEQFTKGCNILHRLQVYHLTLTFIININTIFIYIHAYTYNYDCSNNNAFFDRINVRYKLLGTLYMREADKNS